MDALSEIISLLRPKAAIAGVTESYSPWGIQFSGYDYVKFGFISEGDCWLTMKGQKNVLLEEGDAWILIRPLTFRVGSEVEGPTAMSEDFFRVSKPRYITGKPSLKNRKSVIFGGGLYFDQTNSGLVLDNLPPVIVLKKEQVSNSLKSIMGVLQYESHTSAMGSKVVIEALIQLIFIEAIRTMDFNNLKIGILKGLNHPEINKVIDAIHKDYKRDWTVAELAKIYGASRSSFAANFKSTLGMSPMEYVQRWRMIHAKEALRHGQQRISDIAYSVGYESVTAFSTAFSKVVGQAPKAYREEAQCVEA
ncbi:MAG: AraC family transcriptional regulator [Proteobacteria bacterium]|nr:MAG: AraC family transcriptional regulator [Pseudomonadota bacterium]